MGRRQFGGASAGAMAADRTGIAAGRRPNRPFFVADDGTTRTIEAVGEPEVSAIGKEGCR